VESEIDAFDGIAESAVIGVPHPDFGEGVVAIAVATNSGLTEADILEPLKKRLANYKLPKRVLFVESLPRNTMGKVQKNLLRETYRDLFLKK
jgi:malonyl-CoA/methylmalonyl-CoA synthetase